MKILDTTARTRTYAAVGCFAVSWLLLAVFLFLPSLDRPIDLIDFHDIVPRIRASGSGWDAFTSVSAFYREHGRANVVSYAYFIAKWYAFGSWGFGWQVVRLIEIAATAVLSYSLLRRLGSGRTGAAVAQYVFLASPASAKVWEWLNVAEAAGTLLLVVIAHLVLEGQAGGRERLRLAAIFCLVLVLALLKEMLLTALVLPIWCLGTLQRSGESSARRLYSWIPRDFLVVLAAAATAAIPILYIALTSPAGAYARHFLGGSFNVTSVILSGLTLLLPFQPPASPRSFLELLVLIAYASILVVGWHILLTSPRVHLSARRVLLLASAFVLSGVVSYAPWHEFRLMYAYPYQLGTGIVVAFGVTGVQLLRSRWRLLVPPAWLAILGVMVSQVYGDARHYQTALQSVRDVAQVVSSLPRDSEVYVRSCGVPGGDWSNLGSLAGRFARTVSLPAPSLLRNESCASASEQLHDSVDRRSVVTLRVVPLLPPYRDSEDDRVSRVIDLSRLRIERYRWSVTLRHPSNLDEEVE